MATTERLRSGYHNIFRRDIFELVPSSAKSILDLGCGTGTLGKALKERQVCRVDGIELNKEAAQEAEKNLDRVWNDNLNRFDPLFIKTKYDCLIFGDILEHLISPWAVLKKFASVLSDGGCIIASIPNIAHPWIISQLQKGLFRYDAAGLLDITHLRFFTKTTIGQLFYRAGLKIVNISAFPAESNPIQYHITAVKPVLKHKDPLATILILTYNAWPYTLQCLDSIKARTEAPYKILVIDNGSTDETIQELRKDPQIFHIENSCNLGFGRGFNIGLQLIDTPYFVISNSDVVVTQDWLTTMINHISADKELAALGPVSNYVSGPQLIRGGTYNDETTLNSWARERLQYVVDPLTYFHRIVFFFTLFKSEVLSKVGVLDERFEIGNFEDDDYCLRIKLSKLKTAFDNMVFVHHYGSRTFAHNKIDYAKIMEENEKKFLMKWNLTQARNSQGENNNARS